MGIVIVEPLISLRRGAVPSILLAAFDDHFVDERLSKAGDLNPGTRLHGSTVLLPDQPFPSAGGRPDADHGARIGGVPGVGTHPTQNRFLYPDRRRVDILALPAVHRQR